MARKPSSSHRGSRPSGAVRPRRTSSVRRADDPQGGETSRPRLGDRETSPGPRRRAKRSDEQVWTPDQPAATRGRSERAPGQRGGPAGGPDHTVNPADLRAGGRDGASEQIENRSRLRGGLGPTEASGERQGMGRGHRRNFDESDDDATTRGQSTADATSDERDSGIRRRTRAMGEPTPHSRTSPRGGRSLGHRSDW